MTILGSIDSYEEEIQEPKYNYGVYQKDDKDDIPMGKCLLISSALHPLAVFMVWFSIFILGLLGITFTIFDKPKPKPKDIEFVLVNKEADPINKNTKYRADRNSRAGGVHDPNRAVSQPVASSQASKPKQASSNNSQAKKSMQPQRPVQPQQKKVEQTKPAQKTPWAPQQTTQTPKTQGEPKAPQVAPRPTVKPSVPKAVKPNNNFNIPVPKVSAPKVAGPTGGPVSGTKTGSGSTSGSTSSGSKYSPSPSFSPSSGGSSTGGRFSPSGAGSGGNIGNPGPGNPKGAPGIDALKEPDFGPYMRELQRRIKMNWEPPKGNESKRVVLLFKIARDGRLISHSVYRSSGLPAADRAAMHAVELTAPFKPLPPEYKGDSVDIQFTFDYNVFGATSY